MVKERLFGSPFWVPSRFPSGRLRPRSRGRGVSGDVLREFPLRKGAVVWKGATHRCPFRLVWLEIDGAGLDEFDSIYQGHLFLKNTFMGLHVSTARGCSLKRHQKTNNHSCTSAKYFSAADGSTSSSQSLWGAGLNSNCGNYFYLRIPCFKL